MLIHRLRRWPNIKRTLFQCVVFAGMGDSYMTMVGRLKLIREVSTIAIEQSLKVIYHPLYGMNN